MLDLDAARPAAAAAASDATGAFAMKGSSQEGRALRSGAPAWAAVSKGMRGKWQVGGRWVGFGAA